jgi:hypothetical protein
LQRDPPSTVASPTPPRSAGRQARRHAPGRALGRSRRRRPNNISLITLPSSHDGRDLLAGHTPVLPVGKISEMLAKYGRQMVLNGERKGPASDDHSTDRLAEIINLVRTKTSHDFALYKPGTLLRRIERRMVLAGVDDSGRYLDMLRQDPGELELLAKDLLINVTSFFRDSKASHLRERNL